IRHPSASQSSSLTCRWARLFEVLERSSTRISGPSIWTEHQLTNFGRDFVVRDFDISPDGREIALDRVQSLGLRWATMSAARKGGKRCSPRVGALPPDFPSKSVEQEMQQTFRLERWDLRFRGQAR